MTGFGRAEVELPGSGRAVAEVRSVNHRFLEVDSRLPEGLQGLEEEIRALVAAGMARGQVRVSVSVKGTREPGDVVFRETLARKYKNQLESLSKSLGLTGGVSLQMLVSLPQVMTVEEKNGLSSEALRKQALRAVSAAVAGAVKMRRREGAQLEKALKQRIELFEQLRRQIGQRVPAVQKELQQKFAQKIQTVLQQAGQEPAAQDAVLREAAALVQSTDVNEELERLESHLAALRTAVAGRPVGPARKGEQASPGRTMDFLAQELQREINTLGTKLREAEIGRCVVEFKGQIEKLREQAANIE